MRLVIDLPGDQVVRLTETCAAERISRAEPIRRAVTAWLEVGQHELTGRVFQTAFGAWTGLDTDAFLAETRSEWDRERSGHACSSTAPS